MKCFFFATCVAALALSGSAIAAESTTKSAPPTKTTSKKSATKTTKAPAAPAGEKWQCEMGNVMYLSGNLQVDQVIGLRFQGKNYRLPREATTTGADRYADPRSGMVLVVIPSKAMLLNSKGGHRLADECQTAAMLAGAAAPTQAGGLRSAPSTGLLGPSTPAEPQPQPQPQPQSQPK